MVSDRRRGIRSSRGRTDRHGRWPTDRSAAMGLRHHRARTRNSSNRRGKILRRTHLVVLLDTPQKAPHVRIGIAFLVLLLRDVERLRRVVPSWGCGLESELVTCVGGLRDGPTGGTPRFLIAAPLIQEQCTVPRRKLGLPNRNRARNAALIVILKRRNLSRLPAEITPHRNTKAAGQLYFWSARAFPSSRNFTRASLMFTPQMAISTLFRFTESSDVKRSAHVSASSFSPSAVTCG